MTAPFLIESLLDPRRYPHPVDRVELLETHISWVLLAGEFAYKIKKPVQLPFLDYSTRDKRRACCEAELRLNRRYTRDLYLGLVDFDGEPAVRMRRFDEAARLDHVCRRGELTPGHLSGLARTLSAFHQAAAVAPPASRFGTAHTVEAYVQANFDEIAALLEHEQPRLARLRAWSQQAFESLRALIERRRVEGRVRECHGDLHLGNLVLLDGQVTPFDCIEFNEDLRWIDVASELAFTYLDLIEHGKPGYACWLLNEWLAWSGDFSALGVLRYYAVYRAMVRAKVAALRGAAAEAGDYLALGETLAAPPAARLWITFGVSGSGKTTVSRAQLLADVHASTIRMRSDVERKRLFQLEADAHSGGVIYTAEAGDRTYDRLATLAQGALADGWSVIVDATFLRRSQRAAFHALARAADVPFAILVCDAPPEEPRRRILARAGDASEADSAVLERQLAEQEELAPDEFTQSI